jgi:hypothetical protein
MPRHDDDDDRSRPSWRDIDRKKDKSLHVDRTDPYKKANRGARAEDRSKSYRSALDSFFDGGTLPERYQKLTKTKDALRETGDGSPRQVALRRLKSAVGRSEVEAAFADYLAVDSDLPRDPEALLAVLQHSNETYVRGAIVLLGEIAGWRSLPRKELLRQRLRQIEDLAEEPETVAMASELRYRM